MGDDHRVLAAVYAPTFFVGGPDGEHDVANDAYFLDHLGRVRVLGYISARDQDEEMRALGLL